MMNTCDYLLERADDDDVAIVDAMTSYTYRDLKASIAAVSIALAPLGLEPGARVGIIAPNGIFWVASYLAALRLGLVAVPFSLMLTPEEALRNATFADCKAVLMDRRQRRAFEPVLSPVAAIILDEVLFGGAPAAYTPSSGDFDPGADAALMFTSGTTAAPKAVRVTHENIQANTESIIRYLALGREDRMLVILPFFYCFGLSLLHTHLRVGGRVALCNSFAFPETALDMIEREACTGFAGVPSSFQLLLRISTFKARSLPSLRSIQQAGGKLHRVLVEELAAAKPGVRIFIMYGQTEATARLSFLPPEDLARKPGSIGKGIPGVTLRVARPDGSPVSPGETGEIIARGKNISPGYLDNPAESARKFAGGELHTGDLATVDEDGYIYVVDRLDDFIKTWGYRVSSQEIESCILRLPDVVAAAAVGVPDLEAGESIAAFVSIRPGASTSAQDIIGHCRASLSKHMVPKIVRIVGALPLNQNGKVLKSELRKMASS